MITINGIKVGTTEITSTYIDGTSSSDTQSFEVTAVSLVSISKPDDTVYTGSSFEPTPTVMAVVGGVTRTLELGTDYTLSYSNNINVGQATVIATGKGNYTGTVSETWNITGAEISVTANDQTYTYDGNYHGSGVTVTTVNNQSYEVRYRTTSSGSYNLTSYPTFRDVVNSGYNNVVYYQVTANNHVTYTGSYQLQIYPLEAVLSWGDLAWMYDGNEHHTTCTVTNLIGNDTCTVTLYNNSITEVGSITVTARKDEALSNSNYFLSEDISRTLIVSPGIFIKISSNWTPVKKVYKKVSGDWVEQNANTAFSTSEMYIKMN